MKAFEKMGLFYLGKQVDPKSGERTDDYFLYDSKDLVTHAVCVGMTGSGKTGLCVTLLEEAAIDNIPALVIDPKGDMGNLLLTFPRLAAEDFLPWIHEEEARRQNLPPEKHAEAEAEKWKKGLASWEQDPARIEMLRNAAEFAVYTPGSSAGLPVSILSSFAAPPPESQADADLFRDRISSVTSGLLALLGIQADPLKSREHILISNILEHCWKAGEDLTLPSLIQKIQAPPVQRIGVFDLETFFPSPARLELAMTLNNLLAAPGFETWLQGEALDVGRMLYTEQGRPRVAVFSIAHLSDAERMFFVTLLLNQTLGWMRSQPGTGSLRAILYMDEIFGYFPPVAEPPSKKPLLTLLKQGRAFGIGVVLATQNPVDLDYKGLSNTGTWFIGRLQTERDRDRLVDGLAGASQKGKLDPKEVSKIIAGLEKRVFFMQNVHEESPVLFQTRWALSYLAGPMTRDQIKRLGQTPAPVAAAAAAGPAPTAAAGASTTKAPPPLPGGVRQFFTRPRQPEPGETTVYQPFLFGTGKLRVVSNTYGITVEESQSHAVELRENQAEAAWELAQPLDAEPERIGYPEPEPGAFLPCPTTLFQPKELDRARKDYADYLYRSGEVTLWKSAALKEVSQPNESERDFRIRLQQVARERRDEELEKLRKRYASKTTTLERRLLRAQQRIEREQEQYGQQKIGTMISLGATVLGALMGRKALSTGTLGRAATTARGASRIAREKQDVARAQEDLEATQAELQELEEELQRETDKITQASEALTEELQPVVLRPKKSDIVVAEVGVLWMPSRGEPDRGST